MTEKKYQVGIGDPAEEAILRRQYKQGIPIDKIAELHSRTYEDMCEWLFKLGLLEDEPEPEREFYPGSVYYGNEVEVEPENPDGEGHFWRDIGIEKPDARSVSTVEKFFQAWRYGLKVFPEVTKSYEDDEGYFDEGDACDVDSGGVPIAWDEWFEPYACFGWELIMQILIFWDDEFFSWLQEEYEKGAIMMHADSCAEAADPYGERFLNNYLTDFEIQDLGAEHERYRRFLEDNDWV